MSAGAPAGDAVDTGRILNQIEYYFSDSNFRHDKFLRGKAAEDSDGYVPLTVIATFNRIKTITTDVEVIAKALESSTELELSSDRTAVRRTRALPEDDDSEQRSVYVVSSAICGGPDRVRNAYDVVWHITSRRSDDSRLCFIKL